MTLIQLKLNEYRLQERQISNLVIHQDMNKFVKYIQTAKCNYATVLQHNNFWRNLYATDVKWNIKNIVLLICHLLPNLVHDNHPRQ